MRKEDNRFHGCNKKIKNNKRKSLKFLDNDDKMHICDIL